MISKRNLEFVDYSKEDYREILELLTYIKAQKKKKEDIPAPKSRFIENDYKLPTQMGLQLLKKPQIYCDYSYYLTCIAESSSHAFELIFSARDERSKELMDLLKSSDLFGNLKKIIEDQEGLRQNIRQLLCTILDRLIIQISSPHFSKTFSDLFFEILSQEKRGQISGQLEETLHFIHKERLNENMHPAAIPILLTFAQYCFIYVYDSKSRKLAFEIIYTLGEKGEEAGSRFIFNFIQNNLNDLYFKETIGILNKSIETLCHKDSNLASKFLLGLLNYQEDAQIVYLKSFIEMKPETLKTQEVGNFERIKLLICTKGENNELSQLAQNVLNLCGGKLSYNQITNIDYIRLVEEIPFDLHDTTAQIISEAVTSLDSSEDKEKFLRNLIDNCKTQVFDRIEKVKENEKIEQMDEEEGQEDEHRVYLNIEEVEEVLGIFPVIFTSLISNVSEKSLEYLFDMFIALESNYLPLLTEKFCSVGINYINHFSKISEILISIFETRIDQREGIIFPLVFLGVAAQHINNKKSSRINFRTISEKIIGLSESTDLKFQSKLGKYISRLLIFFDEPEKLIENMLIRVTEEKEPVRIRAKCFAISGIIRGMGVKLIEKYEIFDKIHAIIRSSDKKDLKDVPKHQKYFVVYILDALLIFEPKFPEVLPSLMKLFGDHHEELRFISTQVLNTVMTKLTGFGVKSILPILLEGCKDSNWRSKLNNLFALGSIAHCASKQLASCLPQIVPELTIATTDTNKNIQEVAIKSLDQLLSTIKTPEIVGIRESLIMALSKPYDENGRALETLLNTSFSHIFDTSSVALVMPIIFYGLRNSRESRQRENAAKVLANI